MCISFFSHISFKINVPHTNNSRPPGGAPQFENLWYMELHFWRPVDSCTQICEKISYALKLFYFKNCSRNDWFSDLTNWLTHSLTHSLHGAESFWEADSRVASLQILRLSCNLKAQYRVHKGTPLNPTSCYNNPVHTFPHPLFNIHFNVILPSLSTSSE
jgi:hypothetical protein